MTKLTNLDFVALDISGKNYLSWVLDAEIHLDAKGLGDTIKEGNQTSSQDKAKAMIFLRHHIHEGLKNEYLTEKDPLALWKNLKERYDHQKTVILPQARYEWMHLRLQDFKKVSDYNSALFRITSKLKLCGETITENDMLEKTFSTFHASNIVLQQQYREKGFTKYSELISCLLVAEQNNELLMKNHESRPVGTTPLPEVKAESHYHKQGNNRGYGQNNNRGRGRGRGYGRGRGRGRGFGRPYDRDNNSKSFHSKGKNSGKNEKSKDAKGSEHIKRDICYRCGSHDHWAKLCRTPGHLVDLYQASLKNKGKEIETNFAGIEYDSEDGQMETTHFADLFPEPKNDHQVKDESA